MGWDKDWKKGTYADNKGTKSTDYKIKSDKHGNPTDVIYSTDKPKDQHAHGWDINKPGQGGSRHEGKKK